MDNYKQNIEKVILTESRQLGSEINHKLKLARQKALQPDAQTKTVWFWYIPSTAVAALALYFFLPLLDIKSAINEPLDTEQFIAHELVIDMNLDMEILEQLEQLELVENLEFYEWLSSEDNNSSI